MSEEERELRMITTNKAETPRHCAQDSWKINSTSVMILKYWSIEGGHKSDIVKTDCYKSWHT